MIEPHENSDLIFYSVRREKITILQSGKLESMRNLSLLVNNSIILGLIKTFYLINNLLKNFSFSVCY